MKKILILCAAALVVVLALVLGTNKTFFHSSYDIVNEAGNGASITVLSGSFFAGESPAGTAVFYRLGSQKAMQDQLNFYVENLTSCYDDAAFCDTEQDFTIYKYEVAKGFLVHKITLVYKGVDLKDIENATGVDLVTLAFQTEDLRLMQGDSYRAYRNGTETSSLLNGASKGEPAVTGRGIALGAGTEEVLSAYGIAEGSGLWLDLPEGRRSLVLAYDKEESQWNLRDPEGIGSTIAWLNGRDPQKPGEFLLIYRFDFEPLGTGGALTLTGYRVEYL